MRDFLSSLNGQVVVGIVLGMLIAWIATALAGFANRRQQLEIERMRSQMLAREIARLSKRLGASAHDRASQSNDEELLMTKLLEYSMIEHDSERAKGIVIELESGDLGEQVERVVHEAKDVLVERAKDEEVALRR